MTLLEGLVTKKIEILTCSLVAHSHSRSSRRIFVPINSDHYLHFVLNARRMKQINYREIAAVYLRQQRITFQKQQST